MDEQSGKSNEVIDVRISESGIEKNQSLECNH